MHLTVVGKCFDSESNNIDLDQTAPSGLSQAYLFTRVNTESAEGIHELTLNLIFILSFGLFCGIMQCDSSVS